MTGKMIVLLLLGIFFTKGFSYEETYGDTHSTWIPRKTKSIEFRGVNSPDVTIVWNQDGPAVSPRHKVVRSYFKIEKVNRRDSGTYTMKDKDQIVLSTKTLVVTESKRYNTLPSGLYFDFTHDLDPPSCNIYFIPDGGYESQIVREGRLLDDFDDQECDGLDFFYPCGLSKNYMRSSCNGRFEIRDRHDDLAIVEFVEVEPEKQPPEFNSYIGIGCGVTILVIGSCCCTLRRCFCRKRSSKKNVSESPDQEATAHYHQYDSEPVGQRPEQLSRPSQALYPTVPSYNPSVPLIHNPPSVSLPPAYSEDSAPAEQPGAPTFPVPSEDPEPRFELSFPTAFPLSSNSTFSDVYTSDKLNFC